MADDLIRRSDAVRVVRDFIERPVFLQPSLYEALNAIPAAPALLAALKEWQKVREAMGDASKGIYRVRWEHVRDMDALADAAVALAEGGVT